MRVDLLIINKVMKEKTKWFDSTWATFFIALITSKLIQAVWVPDFSLVILLPIAWLIIHLVFGRWIAKYSKQDLFGRDKKDGSESSEMHGDIETKKLEGKAWFRLLKVMYVGSFVLGSLFIVLMIMDQVSLSFIIISILTLWLFFRIIQITFYYVVLGRKPILKDFKKII
jgi:hypothetical protein